MGASIIFSCISFAAKTKRIMTQKNTALMVFLFAPISGLCLPIPSKAQTPTYKPWLMKPNYTHTCTHSQLTAKQIAKEYEKPSFPIAIKIPKDYKILPNRRKFTTISSQEDVLVPEYFEDPSGFNHDFRATAICEIEDTRNTYWLVISDGDGTLSYFNVNNIIYLN